MKYVHSMGDAMSVAAQKTGIEGWIGYLWSAADGGDIIHGCVPSGFVTRGKNKGRPKFRPGQPGTERTVVVTEADLDAAAKTYESTQLKCWTCKGEAKTISSMSVESGPVYRVCHTCKGSGVPSNAGIKRRRSRPLG